MAFDRDAILAQIEQDKDRLKDLVNGDKNVTVVLEARTVKSIQGQLDDAIGTQIAEANSILTQTQDLRDATATDTAAAQTAATLAGNWASAAPGVEVTPGNESAYSYSTYSSASAAAALASENAAAASETAAAASATAASTSEGNAAASATAASNSATAALASQNATQALLDEFQGQYYGAFASDPALDPLGNAPTDGDMYLNTTVGEVYFYLGTVWKSVVEVAAVNVPFTPAGDIAATDVQAALAELDTEKVPRTATTGAAAIPSGTTAQRPGTPLVGYLRDNTTTGLMERWNGAEWVPVGSGAKGGGGDQVFVENDQVVTQDYTIPADKNASSTGPITINAGVTVTISAGARWLIH